MARPTNPRSTIIICRDGARRDTAKLLVDPSAPSRSPCATIATTSRPSGSLASARAARFTYLVLEGGAYSRFPPGMTWCGSGVETELLWLKLDASLAVVAHDTARVESCLDAIEAEVHQLGGHGLTIVAAQSTEGKVTSRTRISYDARHPAAGLVKQPIENKTEN